jgi:hypothetical protein
MFAVAFPADLRLFPPIYGFSRRFTRGNEMNARNVMPVYVCVYVSM